jgi:FkbM family methyltransferase
VKALSPIDAKDIAGINQHETQFLYDEIFVKQTYLRHGLALLDDSIVFDVGANIGVFSLFVAARCPYATIYSFEPVQPIFRILERNMRPFANRTHLFCCGLSDVTKIVSFTYYPGYTTMSVNCEYADTVADRALIKRYLFSRRPPPEGHEDATSDRDLEALLDYRFREEHCDCQLRPMSDIIDAHNVQRIDLLKIDVQRAEACVINGIREEHWPLVKQIAMEVHDESEAASSGRLQMLTELLRARGFRVTVEQEPHLSGTDRHNLFASRVTS